MMLKNNKENQGDIKETLAPILRVLSQLGGRFSFSDDEGRQFVIMRQEDLKSVENLKEKQLTLPPAPLRATSADDVLEKINREIDLWHITEQESVTESDGDDDFMEDGEGLHGTQKGVPEPPGRYGMKESEESLKRVRFESIKGDLDPELQ